MLKAILFSDATETYRTTNDKKMYSNNTYMPKKPTHGSKTSIKKPAAEFLIEVHFIL